MATITHYENLNRSPASSNAAAVIKISEGGEIRIPDMHVIADGVVEANYGTDRMILALADKVAVSDKFSASKRVKFADALKQALSDWQQL